MNQLQLLELHNQLIERKMLIRSQFDRQLLSTLKTKHPIIHDEMKQAIETALDACTIDNIQSDCNALNIMNINAVNGVKRVAANHPGVIV